MVNPKGLKYGKMSFEFRVQGFRVLGLVFRGLGDWGLEARCELLMVSTTQMQRRGLKPACKTFPT